MSDTWKCTLRERALGDGCSICNPELESELASSDCSADEDDRRPIALMQPTVLFDEQTANSINWKAYYHF
jgi:hypothetical protein